MKYSINTPTIQYFILQLAPLTLIKVIYLDVQGLVPKPGSRMWTTNSVHENGNHR